MAHTKNDREASRHPEKVVVVAGPSFGTAMRFVLLGAALGAAGTFYWLNGRGASTSADAFGDADSEDAVAEGLSGGGAKSGARAAQLNTRLNALAGRVKSLAGRARETAQQAREVLGPRLSEAVAEARSTAQTTQRELEEDLERPPLERSPDAPSASPSVASEQA